MGLNWKIAGKFAMAGAVIAAAMLFSAVAIYRYDRIVEQVGERAPNRALVVEASKAMPVEQRVAALLELEVVSRRYDQIEAAMLSKLWTRNMGFVTGMVLALVGAAFVLGELRIDPSEVSGGSEGLKLAVTSSSPGLILAALGVALIAVSLTIGYSADSKDVPVYFRQIEPPAIGPPASLPADATGAEQPDKVDDAQDSIRKALGGGG